jgi:hypothetical protein
VLTTESVTLSAIIADLGDRSLHAARAIGEDARSVLASADLAFELNVGALGESARVGAKTFLDCCIGTVFAPSGNDREYPNSWSKHRFYVRPFLAKADRERGLL